jgi:hypothetical protein
MRSSLISNFKFEREVFEHMYSAPKSVEVCVSVLHSDYEVNCECGMLYCSLSDVRTQWHSVQYKLSIILMLVRMAI